MRSERREACCRLLAAIAHYCDLPSLCLSVPQEDGSLRPIRMETLAACADLTLRRAERAMHDIVAVPIVDRLISYSHVFMLGGESNRLKQKIGN
jgi:hypothetical protein